MDEIIDNIVILVFCLVIVYLVVVKKLFVGKGLNVFVLILFEYLWFCGGRDVSGCCFEKYI